MRISISADDVSLDVARNTSGDLAPALAKARNGAILIELTRAELQGMLMAFAQAAAAEQGAKIESAELSLSQAGDRAIAATLRVKAKKAFIPATVIVEGRADVDERLSVKLSNLRCTGEGMVGSVVAGVLSGKLKPFDGRELALAPEPLQKVRLEGLRVEAGDPVRLSATFQT